MDGWWARWALGLLVFSAALFLTLLLAPLKESGPFTLFTLFIGATAVSSWYGGSAVGLTVASLSVLTGSYFIHAPVDLHPVELAAIVGQVVDSARPAAEERGVQLDTEFARVPGTVVGDPDRLEQVVRNLLSNAIKFTPRGGRVAVQVGGDEQKGATITVRDTGQGIPHDFLAYIFDRFRQGGSLALTRTHGGLGLGLAIMRDLVELHGGTVRAESGGEGQGARFTVTLPVGERGRQRAAPLALATAHATW